MVHGAARTGDSTTTVEPIARECATFCRYLLNQEPEPYVVAKYVDGHARLGSRLAAEDDPAGWLVALACRGKFTARVVDTYTRVFRPASNFRRKITLLIAILETAPGTDARFRSAAPISPVAFLARFVPRALAFAAYLALAIIVIGPFDIASRRGSPWSG